MSLDPNLTTRGLGARMAAARAAEPPRPAPVILPPAAGPIGLEEAMARQIEQAAAAADVNAALLTRIRDETGIAPFEFLELLSIPPNAPPAQRTEILAALEALPAEEVAGVRRAVVIGAQALGPRIAGWLAAWAGN